MHTIWRSGATAAGILAACGLIGAAWSQTGTPAVAPPSSNPLRFAYVTNQGSQTVSVVDLDAWTVVAEIDVPGRPAGVALSPDHATIYVSAPEGKDVAVIDAAKRKVVRRIPAGDGPLGIAVAPDGQLFVADWYATYVSIIDPTDGKRVATLTAGQSPSGIAISDDGRTVISADRDSNQVSITRFPIAAVPGQTAAGRSASHTTNVVPVGTRPFGVTLNADATRAYTANVGSNDVTVVDVEAGKPLASISVGRRPYAIALSLTHGFVTDQYGGTITVFDLATNSVTKTVEACDHPEGIGFDPGRRMVYVACWGDNVLLRLSADTFELGGKLAVGDGPRAFGVFLGR
ncbi:MAG: YncE family protein [Hyphomicrobium aestuarii]|nr:YncE family protein [Hyphomicrobium aestuarii]